MQSLHPLSRVAGKQAHLILVRRLFRLAWQPMGRFSHAVCPLVLIVACGVEPGCPSSSSKVCIYTHCSSTNRWNDYQDVSRNCHIVGRIHLPVAHSKRNPLEQRLKTRMTFPILLVRGILCRAGKLSLIQSRSRDGADDERSFSLPTGSVVCQDLLLTDQPWDVSERRV
jgi:hypothetical protein